MCSNYEPVTSADRLLAFFGAKAEGDAPQVEAWPMKRAPFIRLAEDGSGNRICDTGTFGLLPSFATELAYGRKTYNARTETVASKPSFRQAWAAGRRCIIPAERIFEPNWETGEAVRWAIQHPGQAPMAIAGIYWPCKLPDASAGFSFAMLTVNADGHPVMQRFHKPGDEKRMVVILSDDQFNEWLSCPVAEAPKFFTQWMGHLDAYAAPLAPRAKKASSPPPPARAEGIGDLF